MWSPGGERQCGHGGLVEGGCSEVEGGIWKVEGGCSEVEGRLWKVEGGCSEVEGGPRITTQCPSHRL